MDRPLPGRGLSQITEPPKPTLRGTWVRSTAAAPVRPVEPTVGRSRSTTWGLGPKGLTCTSVPIAFLNNDLTASRLPSVAAAKEGVGAREPSFSAFQVWPILIQQPRAALMEAGTMYLFVSLLSLLVSSGLSLALLDLHLALQASTGSWTHRTSMDHGDRRGAPRPRPRPRLFRA